MIWFILSLLFLYRLVSETVTLHSNTPNILGKEVILIFLAGKLQIVGKACCETS